MKRTRPIIGPRRRKKLSTTTTTTTTTAITAVNPVNNTSNSNNTIPPYAIYNGSDNELDESESNTGINNDNNDTDTDNTAGLTELIGPILTFISSELCTEMDKTNNSTNNNNTNSNNNNNNSKPSLNRVSTIDSLSNTFNSIITFNNQPNNDPTDSNRDISMAILDKAINTIKTIESQQQQSQPVSVPVPMSSSVHLRIDPHTANQFILNALQQQSQSGINSNTAFPIESHYQSKQQQLQQLFQTAASIIIQRNPTITNNIANPPQWMNKIKLQLYTNNNTNNNHSNNSNNNNNNPIYNRSTRFNRDSNPFKPVNNNNNSLSVLSIPSAPQLGPIFSNSANFRLTRSKSLELQLDSNELSSSSSLDALAPPRLERTTAVNR